MKRNVAVILAGGKGERSGLEQPKQMVKLAGRPLVEHTIEAFQTSPAIHEIVILLAFGSCRHLLNSSWAFFMSWTGKGMSGL